jgi:hypothetical protein
MLLKALGWNFEQSLADQLYGGRWLIICTTFFHLYYPVITPNDNVCCVSQCSHIKHQLLSILLRPTVSRPVCLGIKHSSGAYDQIFITVRQLQVCRCEARSLKRGRVCRLQFLLVLASAVILGFKSRVTRDHILMSQIRDFPFSRLLRVAGLRWRYSTPPPHVVPLLSTNYL